MKNNIWKRDEYNLKKYSPGDIDYFLDIGACIGHVCLLFKTIDTFAKVFAIEPCRGTFEILRSRAEPWDIRCHNIALGNGEKLRFHRRWNMGSYRFYTDSEPWALNKIEYRTRSLTLPQLITKFGIKERYIIKCDCEGGERFLLHDEKSVEVIKGAVQFNMELHKGIGGPYEEWVEWFNKFKDTHYFYRRFRGEYTCYRQAVYKQIEKPIDVKRMDYMLVKK